jgi:hypothetical protein
LQQRFLIAVIFVAVSACSPGKIGDSCSADSQCAGSAVCDPLGRCASPRATGCGGDGDCRQDSTCDLETRSCRPLRSGECRDGDERICACELDSDCPRGGRCTGDGVCDWGDAPGTDGGPGEMTCETITDCPLHQYCYLGTRTCKDLEYPACREDGLCRTGEVCTIAEGRTVGRCDDGGSSGDCQNDNDCPLDHSCIDTLCVPDSTDECLGDDDCGVDQVCQAGRCVDAPPSGCRDDVDCAANERCVAGRCIASGSRLGQPCDANTPCAAGESCSVLGANTALCVTPCGSSRDCASGSFCWNVAGSRQCLPERLLEGGGCGEVGAPLCETRLQPGEACGLAGIPMCQSLLCIGEVGNGSCRNNCGSNANCGAREFCFYWPRQGDLDIFLTGACSSDDELPGRSTAGAVCMSDSVCQSGLCSGGACLSPCNSSGDCSPAKACRLFSRGADVLGICDTPVAIGAGRVGTACQSGADCRSGLCHEEGGYCFDLCSGPADCGNNTTCQVVALELDPLTDVPTKMANVCLR